VTAPSFAGANDIQAPPAIAIDVSSSRSSFSPLTSDSNTANNSYANTVSSISEVRESALSSIPSWLDKESVKEDSNTSSAREEGCSQEEG